jgi:hypothetical protein
MWEINGLFMNRALNGRARFRFSAPRSTLGGGKKIDFSETKLRQLLSFHSSPK